MKITRREKIKYNDNTNYDNETLNKRNIDSIAKYCIIINMYLNTQYTLYCCYNYYNYYRNCSYIYIYIYKFVDSILYIILNNIFTVLILQFAVY